MTLNHTFCFGYFQHGFPAATFGDDLIAGGFVKQEVTSDLQQESSELGMATISDPSVSDQQESSLPFDISPSPGNEWDNLTPNLESNLKQPLPKEYEIPEFPTLVVSELNQMEKIFQATGERRQLSKKGLTKVLDTIASDVAQYTIKPSPQYKLKIAKALVAKYPSLAPEKDPCSKWVYRLNDKFASLRSQLRKVKGGELFEKHREVTPRSLQGLDLDKRQYRKYRGEVNASPRYPDGESRASLERATAKLQVGDLYP